MECDPAKKRVSRVVLRLRKDKFLKYSLEPPTRHTPSLEKLMSDPFLARIVLQVIVYPFPLVLHKPFSDVLLPRSGFTARSHHKGNGKWHSS